MHRTSSSRDHAGAWRAAVHALVMCSIVTAAAAVECDPEQQPKLTASNGAAGDRFGIAVSIFGEAAISGAYLKNVNGPSSGAAYIFEQNEDGAWIEQPMLAPSDGAQGDWFGVSVSIHDGVALIGAQLNNNANGDNAGAAYIFRRLAIGWAEEAKLIAADGAASDWLGHSVSIRGDLAVAGAHLHDEGGTNAGAAYVFRHLGDGQWSQEAKLIASDPEPGAEFGTSVATDGTTIVIGARLKNDAGNNSGAAYVFRQVDRVWQEEAKLAPIGLEAGDEFGFEVAIDGDRTVVSARLDNDAGQNAGALYVFARNARGEWPQEAKLIGNDLQADDRLGEGLGMHGDFIIGGARQHDAAAPNGGAAYVFARGDDGAWSEVAKLIGSDVGAMHFFGIAAGLHDGRAIVGANLDPELGSQAGAAYIFDLNCSAGIPGDLNGDGVVDVFDLLILLSAWGECAKPGPGADCPADLNGDGVVDVFDLLILLSNWG